MNRYIACAQVSFSSFWWLLSGGSVSGSFAFVWTWVRTSSARQHSSNLVSVEAIFQAERLRGFQSLGWTSCTSICNWTEFLCNPEDSRAASYCNRIFYMRHRLLASEVCRLERYLQVHPFRYNSTSPRSGTLYWRSNGAMLRSCAHWWWYLWRRTRSPFQDLRQSTQW